MSLNLTVDGDNSSCAFVGTTTGSGVSLGGVLGCGSNSGSSGDGSPGGWSGKHLTTDTQAVPSISTSAAVAPNVSVVNSGHLPNSSLGSWTLNSPTPSSNSHFANTSMQTQQLPQTSPQQQHSTPSPPSQLQVQPHSQTQQSANPNNGTGAMTTAAISGDIIVDSQDNEAWPSITSMTSTNSTTGSNNNSNVNKPVSNVTNSAAPTVSSGQLSGGTPGVLLMNPPPAPTDSDSSDVWGATTVSTGSSWGGPFAQPPTVTSSSSLASLWGGSSNVLNSDPNYSPWGNTNSVMPHTTGSLWASNAGSSAASPHEQTSVDWNNQQSQGHDMQRQQQQLMQQQQSHSQQPQLMQQNIQMQQMQQQQQQQQQTQRSQSGQQSLPQQRQLQQQPSQQPNLQNQQLQNQIHIQQQSQMQQILQRPTPQSQAPPLPSPQTQSQSSAQSPTWGSGSNGSVGGTWLSSAGPSSRATPTNEVAAINSEASSEGSGQTWAQAAGKGVPEAPTPVPSGVKSPEDLMKDENERQVWALVNSNDGWGKRPVNQSTPWDCGLVKEDQMKHVDSNVWMNEPPNGTGQWEHHYESLGEKTARWSVLSKSSSMGPSGPQPNPQWGRSTSVSGAEMGGGGDGPFWNGQTWERGSRNAPPNRLHSVSGLPSGGAGTWNSDEWSSAPSHRSSVSDASDWNRGTDQWMGASGATTPTNTGAANVRWGQGGGDEGSNMWNNPQNQSGSVRGSMHSDDFNRRMPMSNNSGGGNRNNMRAHVIRKLMEMGFRREDAQQALISHNMNFERALQELQNKRSMGMSGANELNQPQSGSAILSRNQPMNMQGHNQQQVPMQSQQQHSQSQVHQQAHMQQQQNQHSHQQQQQPQQTANQPPQQHQQQQQQQLMRQQIMTQLQASVQNRMQAGNGNSSSGNMPQMMPHSGNQNLQSTYQQQQLQQQMQQLKQQVMVLQHRGKTLQNQYMSANAMCNVGATRNIQQQIEQVNNEIQNIQKHMQTCNMKLMNLQNSSQQSPQTQQQQQNPQQSQQQQQQQSHHQHFSQSSQHHTNSNMMNQQLGHDRQYANQMTDMIDRMSGMMAPTNGMTNNHMNVGGWKSSEQNAAGWYNIPSMTDDQRSHGLGQNNMNANPQVSTLSMDIPEFVPGKPWQGMKDDPNMTVGGSRKGVFNTLNNDHLEKLSTKDTARSPQSPSGPYGPNHRRHHGGYNGTSPMYHQYGSTCILIRNMPSNVTVDLIKVMVGQYGPVLALQPNLNAGWVLVRFANPEDAVKAQKSLINAHFGQVESITDNEAQRLQQEIQALAARFNPNAWSNNFVGVPGGDTLPPEPHLIPGDI